MLKVIIIILLLIVFSAYASFGIAWQLESASATRARRDENIKRRSLELGIKGRILFTLTFSVIFILIMIASHIKILSMILGLLLSIILVIGNTYLRSNGIRICPQLFALWVSTMISSVAYAHMTTNDALGWVYTVLQVVCLIGLIVGTFAVGVRKLYYKRKAENDEADELDKKVRKIGHEDDDDDEEGWPEEELKKERMFQNAVKFFLTIALIGAAVAILAVLEVKFDFLPPYRF